MTERRRVTHVATVWAIVGLLGVCALGAWLMFVTRGPLGVDRSLHGLVSVETGSVGYALAVALAEIGSGVGATACVMIAVAALSVKRRFRDALSVAFASGLGVLISELTKLLVARPRPADPLIGAAGLSFPSGHSMGAAAIACSLLLVVLGWKGVSRAAIRWAWIGAVGWIVLMMWSRLALHVHWLSDTVAGAVLGVSVAILSRRLWVGDRSPTRRL